MALNDIIFQKQNGGMGRLAANEDVISGLIMSMQGTFNDDLSGKGFEITGAGADLLYVAKLNYYEQLSMQFGLAPVDKPENIGDYALNAIAYHVREFFRISPTGTLYLAIRLIGDASKANVKQLQYYTGGKLRQIGILTQTLANVDGYQAACTGTAGVETGLEQEHQPLSVIVAYAGDGDHAGETPETLAHLTTSGHTAAGRSNVSILVGCDLDPALVELLNDFAYYGCIGNALGAVSKAMVHESIAWVQKFPLGLLAPGFISGDLLRNVTNTQLELINDNRYLFVRTHVGTADNYYNDSFTLDVPTSDYGFIENVRTIDKATRGVRANLLPYLNAPLYVDASTGKLRSDMVAFLETTAGRALEDMEKAGELSGYKAEIDPNQNVLATSELEVIIKQVPVGVMRRVKVKIGYTTALN